MMHDWWTSGSWGMGFGWVFMLLPLALLVGLGLAREILDERFSKGEIDREEYEMRRKALIS
jgi:hypothetical protein